jgi:hypothetical protein
MFEKEIKFITDFNLNKIKKSGSFFTITHLAASDVHPAIIQYISAELDYLISIDRQRLLQKSVFDYSGEEISNHLDLISAEIKKEKLIPYEDIKRLISQAVEFNVYFLIRPRWCLKKFIFGDEEIRSHNEIKTFLNYTYFFDYYKNILQAIIEKKKIVSISIYEFEDLIVNLEKQLIQKQQQTFIENALQSLAEFFNLGEIQKSKIAIGIVEKFLYEKGLLNEIFKVRKLLSVDPKSKFEVQEFKEAILSNIFVDASDIEITEKIFEIPKAHVEQLEDLEIKEESEIIQPESESPENLTESNSDFLVSEADNFEEEHLAESEEIINTEFNDELIETLNSEENLFNNEDEVPIANQLTEIESFETQIEVEDSVEESVSDKLEEEVKLESEVEVQEMEVENVSEEVINSEVETEIEIQELELEEIPTELNLEEVFKETEPDEESELPSKDEEIITHEIVDDLFEVKTPIEVEENQDEAAALYEEFLNSGELKNVNAVESGELLLNDEKIVELSELVENKITNDSPLYSEEILTPSESNIDSPDSEDLVDLESYRTEVDSTTDEFDLLKTIEDEIESLQNIEQIDIDSNVDEFLISPDLEEVVEKNDSVENFNSEDEEDSTTLSYEVVDDVSEVREIEEEIESEIPNEIEDNYPTEIIEPIEEATPVKYVIKASADEIFSLFTPKETTKIISSIFQKDELDFVHTVEQISDCQNYKQVVEILNLVFHSYRINSLTQKDAIIFKEKIALYFKEKEK